MSARKRLPQAESRLIALEAAREVLLASGPQAVTLKAVAARIGRTHANLLHHFGSAAGLQQALGEHLASRICTMIGDAFQASCDGEGTASQVVDVIFDAFDTGGGSALASWLLISGNQDALEPIVDEICKVVERFEDFPRVRDVTLLLVLLAMGDAQLGRVLTKSLRLPRTDSRRSAGQILEGALERHRLGIPCP